MIWCGMVNQLNSLDFEGALRVSRQRLPVGSSSLPWIDADSFVLTSRALILAS